MKKNRYIPYGYTIRNGKTVVAQEEAMIIREIFHRYISGASLKDIADELTVNRIPYTEKTSVWDKARIARIIENAKYLGTEEYDPIIEEDIYENALACKEARKQISTIEHHDGIKQIANHVKCEKCGYPMIRKVTAKNRIKESWTCQNPECGIRVRIRDRMLLEKINILLNRIIENNRLLLPKESRQPNHTSLPIQRLLNEMNTELSRDDPNEDLILQKIREIAQERYRSSDANQMLAVRILRQRAERMTPQEKFNTDVFHELISHLTLDEYGYITLHTKTESEITEERNKNDGSTKDPEEGGYGH